MIVIDASAVMAILLREPDAALFSAAIESAEERIISAATVVEIGVVLASKNTFGAEEDTVSFLGRADVRVRPVTRELAFMAIRAYEVYGKKRGHPAQLNLGDCFSYALAKSTGAPLLFKGTDFSQTDVLSAL